MIAITAITCLFFSLSSSNANTQSITHENCICGGFISNGHNYIGDIGQSWQRRMGALQNQSSSKQFIDKNGKGGYTFFFDKSVPKKAKEAFKRAVQKWVDLTGVNWTVSDKSGDSLVTFKNLHGSLGLAYSQWINYYGEPSWITSLKIEFNQGTNWFYGENPSKINFMQYDFETVALHELGHCFQLEHDRDPQELMYPTNRNGETKRNITPNAITGALGMKASAVDRKGIHYTPMKWLDNKNKAKDSEPTSNEIEVEENESFVLRLSLNDNGIFYFSYKITGPDSRNFQVNPISGKLSFLLKPDYENPQDQNKDNIYEISVTASNWFLEETEKIRIRVIDLKENGPPIFDYQTSLLYPINLSVTEKSKEIGQLKATDPENDPLRFSLDLGLDSSLFKIDSLSGFLEFKDVPSFDLPLDYNSDNRYDLVISVSDGFSMDKLWARVSITRKKTFENEPNASSPKEARDKWKKDSWFGIYFQHESGWIYHLRLGWCFLVEAENEWLWLWKDELGWIATTREVFPFVFMTDQSQWVFLSTSAKGTFYYSYRENNWSKIKQKIQGSPHH